MDDAVAAATRQGVPNDLEAFWMPFTANRQFKAAPRLIVGADGMYYTTHDGRQVMDAVAGLWCVNCGHGAPRITKGDPGPGGDARLFAGVPDGAPARVRPGQPARRPGAR